MAADPEAVDMVVSAMKKGMTRQELLADLKEAGASDEEIKEILDTAEAKLGPEQAPSVPVQQTLPEAVPMEPQTSVPAPVQAEPVPSMAAAPAQAAPAGDKKKIIMLVVLVAVAAVAMLFGLGFVKI